MCGLFGFSDPKQVLSTRQRNKLIHALAVASEARGTDAAGIAYLGRDKTMRIFKRPKPAHALHFYVPTGTVAVMGHTRMTTQGNASINANNHPFPGTCKGNPFALAHNGMLWNDEALAKSCKLPKSKVETDSYVAVQMLERYGSVDLRTMAQMAEQMEGTYSFTVLDAQNNLYLLHGNNPLVVCRFEETGLLCYASTAEILQTALDKLNFLSRKRVAIALQKGDVLKVTPQGELERGSFDTSKIDLPRYSYTGWLGEEFRDWSSLLSNTKKKTRQIEATSPLAPLLDTAHALGYAAEDIFSLLEEGFCEEEIEEMLQHPSAMHTAIAESMYGDCCW